ncbi:MAG: hypothetical protein B1H03_05000 [Planctomycetales bacterium 4484_113]|nr:MAG: hypothetical protein B1H03_05000 [Planctomycetales bacterium 4484_113]
MPKLADKFLGSERERVRSSHRRTRGRGEPLPENVRDAVERHRQRQHRAWLVLTYVLIAAGILMIGLLLWPLKTPTGGYTNRGRIIYNAVAPIKPLSYYFQGAGDVYLLLVGLDHDPPHRSDAVMVVHIDLRNLRARVLSVPRDLRLWQPSGHKDKLAHAYVFGQEREKDGAGWVQKSVERLLGIDIPYYLVIDFSEFVQVVDEVGGVELTVEKPLKYHDRAQNLHIDIPAGAQHMDGETLLKYVRFRHDALGDIGRMARQQKAIDAILRAVKKGGIWRRAPALVSQFYSAVTTNLTADQLVALARKLSQMREDSIRGRTLASEPLEIDGVSYQETTPEAIASSVAFLSDFSPPPARAPGSAGAAAGEETAQKG